MIFQLFQLLVSVLILASPVWILAASPLPNWKTECVGHYQFNVPGEIEYPVMPLRNFISGELRDPNRYSDGIVPYNSYPPVTVSDVVTREEFNAFKEAQLRALDNEKKHLIEEAKDMDIASLREKRFRHAAALKEFPLDAPDAFATQSIGGVTGYFYRNGRIYPLYGHPERFGETIKPLRIRAPFEIPSDPGVCFPYGFLADEGKQRRGIAVSMRLKEHPDVEIHFESSRASPPRKGKAATAGSIEEEHTRFWSGYYAPQHKETRLTGLFAYRSVSLDGRKGIKTFGEIKRKNDRIDYGYLAIVKGDSAATEDMPDLLLFVVRTASQSRGKTPVTEDELKEMAETIAASVKRR